MESRTRLYVSGLIAALTAYLFATISITGGLDLVAMTIFTVAFIVVMVGFEHFVIWAETLESAEPATPRV